MTGNQYRLQDGRGRCQAFTLVEAVLVVVIVGILAGIAVPRFTGFVTHQHIEAATRRIITDMALAQRRARITSTAQTVTFDLNADSYTLPGMADPDHPSEPYTVSISDGPYASTITSADFGGDTEVVFDGYGVPDSGGTIVVAAGECQKTLTLNAQTGRVTVSEAAPEEPEEPLPPEEPPVEED